MDIANASLYESGSAVAEAVIMALTPTGRYGEVLVAGTVHPQYLISLKTNVENLEPGIR